MSYSSLQAIRPVFLVLAILGFLTVNIPFLYITFFDRETYEAAMGNSLALLFMTEAMLLMLFFAWMIARLGWKKPGWIFFIAMSLLGSLAFSIPLQIYLGLRPIKASK